MKLYKNENLKKKNIIEQVPSTNVNDFKDMRIKDIVAVTRSNTESNGSDKSIAEILEDYRSTAQRCGLVENTKNRISSMHKPSKSVKFSEPQN